MDKDSGNEKKGMKEEEPQNVLEEIVHEHDEVRTLMTELNGSQEMETVKELFVTIYSHHRAEEEHVFPPLQHSSREADELIQDLLEEHHKTESALQKMIRSGQFDEQSFAEVREELTEHMEEEEEDLFKMARAELGETKLKDVLDPFEETEESAKEKAEKDPAAVDIAQGRSFLSP